MASIIGVDIEGILRDVLENVKMLEEQPNVSKLSSEELRAIAEQHAIKTKYGNLVFMTSVRNRSAGLTVYIGSPRVMDYQQLSEKQIDILEKVPETLDRVHKYVKKAPLVRVDKVMGSNEEFTPICTMYVSTQRKDCIRLAYMLDVLLFNKDEVVLGKEHPHLYLLYIPEWQEKDRQILVFPEIGVTYVLGSDYFGEAKKGFLRMAMWCAKQRGMLGVHAGAKIVKARGPDGRLRRYSMLLFGLSATGKTTHTCHNHGLDPNLGEGIEIVQDDVLFLKKDGSALGTENGFFLKTDIDPVNQPLIWKAATKERAVFENVLVDFEGNVHFLDDTLTGNGRGVFPRSDLDPSCLSPSINLPPLSELDGMIIIFITRRNTVVPIISKLTIEQAAAAFMLGESIETSASDPTRIGESVRVVGTNPFIVGDPAEEGLWFYDFLKQNKDKVQCYLLNTGGVGEILTKKGRKVIVEQRPLRVQIWETASIIRGILRRTIEWTYEPYFGVMVPSHVEGVDIAKFNPENFYTREQMEEYIKQLKAERAYYMIHNYWSFLEKIELTEELVRFIGLDVVSYEFPPPQRREENIEQTEVLDVTQKS
ncbi:MAG: phosphoenolpyruvate carboxykinase (ATP) [Thermoprotei archaeon]|nr:MAG: phosphoenolpyruvate carboxykinase (ATP) [Thermoprotei archaeon]